MHDDDLDVLLEQARTDVAGRSVALSRLVALEAAQQHRTRSTSWRRWLRRGVLVPVGVGALALTGAGTYAAHQLSVPPYVATEPGVERVGDAIQVDYTTDAGTVLDCNLYLEFRDVSPDQRAHLEAMSEDPRWRGLGQRVYDALPRKNRAVQDGPEPLWADRVDKQVYEQALREVPGLVFRGPAGSASLEGSTTRCDYPDADR